MSRVEEIPVESIRPDPRQPRSVFDEGALDRLAASLDEVGQLHPVIVRRDDSGYLLVVGERRWRAARKAGQSSITARIMEGEDRKFIRQMQLIENLQREDLDPVERARAVNAFMEEEGLSRKAAAKKIGIPRTTLTEWLYVLEVDEEYQRKVVENFHEGDSPLTVSHIRLAVSLATKTGDPTKKNKLLDKVLEHKLSRPETRRVLELFQRHFNLTVEEAVQVVCLARGFLGEGGGNGEREGGGSHGGAMRQLSELVKIISEANQKLEGVLENTMDINGELKEEHLEEIVILHRKLEQLLLEVFGFSREEVHAVKH